MSAVVVVPTYNEAANVAALVAGVRAHLPGAHVLVVDDASPDGTAEVARGAGAEVLVRRGGRGLGPAYRHGFARAIAGAGSIQSTGHGASRRNSSASSG